MKDVIIRDLHKEVRFELVYPRWLLSTREDAARMLQMSMSQFDKLRQSYGFREIIIKSVVFIWNTSLFEWAYQFKPEVIYLKLDFGKDFQRVA